MNSSSIAKIDCLFEDWWNKQSYDFRECTGYDGGYKCFLNGYLALLNSLELDEMSCSILYRLPEGVKRDDWK